MPSLCLYPKGYLWAIIVQSTVYGRSGTVREATSVEFYESFSNNRSKALLESLQDDIDDDSDDSDVTDTTELNLPAIPDSQSISPLSSLHPLLSPPSSPMLPALLKSAQVQLERQNRKIAKAAQKLQEKQDRERVAEQRGDRRNPRRADKKKDAEANLARIQAYYSKTIYIPTAWEDAITCPDSYLWQASWQSELQSILDRGTFSEPITIPDGQNTITAKVVWDVKYAEDGSVARYKARPLARGFTQVYGVDYEETFAPTIRYDALRIFPAIAAKNNWKVHQLDIVTAFLAGKLDEIIHPKVPHFLRDILGDYVQILQSIYGLKQAARVWYLLLEEFLRTIGFLPLPSDPSVLTNGKVMISRVALAVYVDDLLIAGKNEEDILHVKQLLKQRFEVKDLGEMRMVLGIRVK